jgi:hypothetical protein
MVGDPYRVLTSCITAAQQCTDIVATVTIGDTVLGLPFLGPQAPVGATRGHIGAMPLYAGEGAGSVRNAQPAGDIVQELVPGAAADSGYLGSVSTAVVLGHLFRPLFGASPLTRSEDELKYRWSGHGHA